MMFHQAKQLFVNLPFNALFSKLLLILYDCINEYNCQLVINQRTRANENYLGQIHERQKLLHSRVVKD